MLVGALGQGLTPAYPLIAKSFPAFGRYTYLLFIYAVSHSLFYLITAYVCDQVTSFQGICFLLFVAASISLCGLYAFLPKHKMLAARSPHDLSAAISWEEMIQEDEKHEILEQKEKDKFLKKWFKKIN